MEKEIERVILEGCMVPPEDWAFAYVSARDAAHAIAEWMRKGVVWERDCRVTHLNSVRGYNAKGTELTDESGDTIFAVILGDWLAEEGARLRLTARVEGGSG